MANGKAGGGDFFEQFGHRAGQFDVERGKELHPGGAEAAAMQYCCILAVESGWQRPLTRPPLRSATLSPLGEEVVTVDAICRRPSGSLGASGENLLSPAGRGGSSEAEAG